MLQSDTQVPEYRGQLRRTMKLEIPTITYIAVSTSISLSALATYLKIQSFNLLVVTNPKITLNDIVLPHLQLIPSKVIFNPWTLLISNFIQTTPFNFLSCIIILFLSINFLYHQWYSDFLDQTTSEILKFLSFIIILTNFTCLILSIIINLFILNNSNYLQLPLNLNLFILILPISIVAKQLKPETNIKILSFFKFRFKKLPFILLSCSLVLSLLKLSYIPFLPILLSFLNSWFYLRYIQKNNFNNTSINGDPSDIFKLVDFFPDSFKIVLNPLFNSIYNLSILLGLINYWNDDDIDNANLNSINRLNNSNSSNTNIDERRKQIALKILQQNV